MEFHLTYLYFGDFTCILTMKFLSLIVVRFTEVFYFKSEVLLKGKNELPFEAV